jgi:SAM-dependent methyltransferase
MTEYALRLDDDELARYRLMAARARDREGDLWEGAGIGAGARIADIGCGPGAMLATLAEIVGRSGYVVGIDADQHAVDAARAALDAFDVAHGEVRVGSAVDSGLPPGSFDTVVLRHVLAHNGVIEQRIVDHAAELVRPGGHVYLLDIDTSDSGFGLLHSDLEDLQGRYVEWHRAHGNDLRVGQRLAGLGRRAGLDVTDARDWYETIAVPPGLRGPAWAARQALVADSFASSEDLARWSDAFERMDAQPERPQMTAHVYAAACRRPA